MEKKTFITASLEIVIVSSLIKTDIIDYSIGGSEGFPGEKSLED